MHHNFSRQAKEILETGGWFQGRRVDPAISPALPFEAFPIAEQVLAEFGGLHLGRCGPGVECATSDVDFNPALAVHLASELKRYGEIYGTKLFPLGEVHRGHGYLVIDESGRTYLMSDDLESFAQSFVDAIEMLLLGREGIRGHSGGCGN